MPFDLTILLADDDRVQNLMLSTRLKERGFKVALAYDANQALMNAMKLQPNAIVLDIQMPGGTGMLVLERLNASSKTNQIPVIVLSGSVDPQVVVAVKKLGANEFLSKPVDLPALYAALSRVLGVPAEAPPESSAGSAAGSAAGQP